MYENITKLWGLSIKYIFVVSLWVVLCWHRGLVKLWYEKKVLLVSMKNIQYVCWTVRLRTVRGVRFAKIWRIFTEVVFYFCWCCFEWYNFVIHSLYFACFLRMCVCFCAYMMPGICEQYVRNEHRTRQNTRIQKYVWKAANIPYFRLFLL